MATEWVRTDNDGIAGWSVIIDGTTYAAITDPSLWSQTDRIWHATVDGISYRMAEHVVPESAVTETMPVEEPAPSTDDQLGLLDEQPVKRRWLRRR